MSFSYGYGTNPAIDYPRLLIGDTVDLNHIFEDSEIVSMTNIMAMQYQSSMFFSPPVSVLSFPAPPTSYFRVAAGLLSALASSKSRLASIKQLLDVKLDASDAAIQLRETAASYLDMDDNSGAFAIIEQVHNPWNLIQRFWQQVQREQAQ